MLDDKQIGRNLVRLRGEMSQKELAELMRGLGFKWSQATVWSVEKGERPLRVVEAEALADALGIFSMRLTAQEETAVVEALARDVHRAYNELREAIKRYDECRFQLAIALDRVPKEQASVNRVAGMADWIETGARDVVDRLHEEISADNERNPDGDLPGTPLTGHWIEVWASNSALDA